MPYRGEIRVKEEHGVWRNGRLPIENRCWEVEALRWVGKGPKVIQGCHLLSKPGHKVEFKVECRRLFGNEVWEGCDIQAAEWQHICGKNAKQVGQVVWEWCAETSWNQHYFGLDLMWLRFHFKMFWDNWLARIKAPSKDSHCSRSHHYPGWHLPQDQWTLHLSGLYPSLPNRPNHLKMRNYRFRWPKNQTLPSQSQATSGYHRTKPCCWCRHWWLTEAFETRIRRGRNIWGAPRSIPTSRK